MKKTTYPYTPEQEAWLRDLETTEEPQTTGFLHDLSVFRAGYCCLGRACVTLGLPSEAINGFSYFLGEYIALPERATTALRLRGDCGEFAWPLQPDPSDEDKIFNHLADLNDNGWTFKEIAAYIRDNPENVFLPFERQQTQRPDEEEPLGDDEPSPQVETEV